MQEATQQNSSLSSDRCVQRFVAARKTTQAVSSMVEPITDRDMSNMPAAEPNEAGRKAFTAALNTYQTQCTVATAIDIELRSTTRNERSSIRRPTSEIMKDVKSSMASINDTLASMTSVNEAPASPSMVTAVPLHDPFVEMIPPLSIKKNTNKDSLWTKDLPKLSNNTERLVKLYESLSDKVDVKLNMQARGRTRATSPTTPETKMWELLEHRVFGPTSEISRVANVSSSSSSSSDTTLLDPPTSSSSSASTFSDPPTPMYQPERGSFIHIYQDWDQYVKNDLERLEFESLLTPLSVT